MMKTAAGEDKKKGIKMTKKSTKKLQSGGEGEGDMLGRLNVVWGYAVIKTSWKL